MVLQTCSAAGALLALLMVASCSDAPSSRTMETTPAGSSAGQAQPARAK